MFRLDHLSAESSSTPRGPKQFSFLTELMHFILGALRSRWVLFSSAPAIARERKLLLTLSEKELADIGISRAQAECEARRAYFDIPENRLTVCGLLDSGRTGSSTNHYTDSD